jgi:hypothetical protein
MWSASKLKPISKYPRQKISAHISQKQKRLPEFAITCKAMAVLICKRKFTLIDARLNDTAQFARASHPPRSESSFAFRVVCLVLVARRNWRSWRFCALLVVVGWLAVCLYSLVSDTRVGINSKIINTTRRRRKQLYIIRGVIKTAARRLLIGEFTTRIYGAAER